MGFKKELFLKQHANEEILGFDFIIEFFSSLHIVLSYLFAFRVWKDHIKGNVQISLLLKTALTFLLLSTFGVWGVAVIMGSGGGGGVLYQVANQFYRSS